VYDWLLDRSFILTWASLIALFYIAMLAGSALYHTSPLGVREQVVSFVREYYESRVPEGYLNPLVFFTVILINNSVVVVIATLLSITLLAPLLIMIANGLIVGFIISLSAEIGGVAGGGLSYLSIYLSIAPHGVIEIPAIALASSAFSIAFRRGLKTFLSSLPSILLLSLSMIFVAALVESTVTIILATIVARLTWMW
jgi:stage II sporulation protein M